MGTPFTTGVRFIHRNLAKASLDGDRPHQSNVCTALSKRELTGCRPPQLNHIPRRYLSLRQVLRQEEGSVLLGFSSDGNFLVYCVSVDSCYEVRWRRVDFQGFYHWREDGEVPEIVFKLRVDAGSSLYGVSSPLEVWQSVDYDLVLAISTEPLDEDRDSARICRVVVAPSPMFDDGGLAAAVTSLSFEFNQHSLSQKMEKWQLMQLVRGQQKVYHLLINAGTAVHVLVFHVRRSRKTGIAKEVAPSGLGISYFPQCTWYYPPVYPINSVKTTEHRQNDVDPDRAFTIRVECICQHLFSVERFLGELLEPFKPFRHCNLVDYDLRLVQASTTEKTVFMSCVMALAPSNREPTGQGGQQLQVAVFLSLELFTGKHHIIRALKTPGHGDLHQISQVVAQRFLADLTARVPSDPTTTKLDNEAFLREASLQELYNPQYPLSISLTR